MSFSFHLTCAELFSRISNRKPEATATISVTQPNGKTFGKHLGMSPLPSNSLAEGWRGVEDPWEEFLKSTCREILVVKKATPRAEMMTEGKHENQESQTEGKERGEH